MTQLYERDLESMFDDCFDESNPMIKFGCLEYLPSKVLKRVDPVAYREELLCYIDSMLTDEIIFEHSDGSYHDEPEDDENDGVSE